MLIKKSKWTSLLLGGFVSICCALPSFADDTEIFFGQSADSFNTNPNVLFVLDTSGSMGWFDDNIQLNRIDRLKLAMGLLLEQSSNFNVGLMGFQGSNSGGAIYYPVVDLEDDAQSPCPNGVCPDELVVVRPGGSNDDATQNDDTKAVTTNANTLRMANIEAVDNSTQTTGNTINGATLVNAISAEYEDSKNKDVIRAITGDNQWFYSNKANSGDDHYAYRFENVSIPPGATVTNAKIVFTTTAPSDQIGDVSAYISLEATATPELLPDGSNGEESINYRLDPVRTTPGVAWENIPPYVSDDPDDTDDGVLAGGKIETPDLSEMVTQVVNLPGWQNGNALSFLFDPFDEYTASKKDVRIVRGMNGNAASRPTLIFSYSQTLQTEIETTTATSTSHIDEVTEQNTGTVSRNLGNEHARLFYAGSANEARKLAFRFDNINIPSNATIKTAILGFETSPSNAADDAEADWVVDDSTVPEPTDDDSDVDDPADNPSVGGDTVEDPAPSNLEEFTITANIAAETTGSPAPYTSIPLRDREFTSEFIEWEDIDKTASTSLLSPDIQTVLASVINSDDWSAGNDLSIMLSAPVDYENIESNSVLFSTSASGLKPTLRITWEDNEETNTSLLNTQTTAIRFKNVNIPPGAEIKSAKLVFHSNAADEELTVLDISAEDTSTSAPFKNVSNDIGDRPKTTEREPWTVDPWSTVGTSFDSPDISKIVQAVTDRSDWCSGNPLTVFLKGSGLRRAMSFDENPVKAPSLRITYAPDTVPEGSFCANTSEQTSIVDARDDAVENTSSKNVNNTTTTLNSRSAGGDSQLFGLRFVGINVPQGASIVSASIQLTAASEILQAQTYSAKVQSSLTTTRYQNVTADLSNRTVLDDNAQGTISPGLANESILNINVTGLVQSKVGTTDWVDGESLAFNVEAVGTQAQSFYAFEGGEAYAPRLVIYYQSERDGGGTLTRDKLTEIVNNLVATGGTPIVGAYYEAAQYFAGGNVDYGLKRGNQYDRDKYHRVSHPESYTGGTVQRDASCTDSDLNSEACITETILTTPTPPAYVSPISSECQQNHIVLLSDGDPTSNTAQLKAAALTNKVCTGTGSEECGLEIAQWLQEVDLDGTKQGIQNVTTHTIGFNLQNEAFLNSIANAGGGGFYSADSAEELLTAFKNIFINVSKTDTSFVAPSATVSQQNRMKNRDDLYFALFRPEPTARWPGNLKRYRVQGANDSVVQILDVNGNIAVDPNTGNFIPSSQSFWSSEADGSSVLLGGAAEKIEREGASHLDRNVYTFTGTNPVLNSAADNALLPSNTNINREWLKLTPTLSADDDYVENLLNWAHGKDIFDIDGDLNTDEARGQMGDPMHSQPMLVNYANGKSVVYVATNEGYLHAFDHQTGEEYFAFMPKELLKNLRRLYENNATRNRPYGLDGGLTLWIDETDKNGVVNGGDTAYLYVGMRRGGDLYYAIDISDPSNPQFVWNIQGGVTTLDTSPYTADGDFEELGDTWSKPVKSKIYTGAKELDVLIFGAGYDPNQDPRQTDDNPDSDDADVRRIDGVGRGLFIVDAKTGNLVWKTNLADNSSLEYSVPSEIRVIDINFDGLADQLYFGDMGGQVWRMDINNDKDFGGTLDNRITWDVIGSFAGNTPQDARRFYYPPDIAVLNIDGEQQLSVSIGSGWRAHPLDTVVQDRFYSFRMTNVYGTPIDSQGYVRYPLVKEDTTGMHNVSNSSENDLDNEQRGWFIDLERAGEKVLSSSVTADNQVIFTTYIPANSGQTCAAAEGTGAIYALDLANGNPVADLDNSGGEQLTNSDRFRPLASVGIPPGPTILFPESGKATVVVGRETLQEIELLSLRRRTFWQEFIDENL